MYIPGLLDFYNEVSERLRKTPELIPSPDFFEMTREESMKYLWTRAKLMMELDPKYWFHSLESGLFDPSIAMPGVAPY